RLAGLLVGTAILGFTERLPSVLSTGKTYRFRARESGLSGVVRNGLAAAVFPGYGRPDSAHVLAPALLDLVLAPGVAAADRRCRSLEGRASNCPGCLAACPAQRFCLAR